jgi:integrase
MRSVHLPQIAINALLEQRERIARESRSAFWRERNLVFPGRFGNYMDGSSLLQTFKRVLHQAGLPEVRFHDLRHSAATLLLAAGVNPKVVQELLGHSSISVTLGMYGHVLPNMQRDVKSKMDDMFGQQP